MSIGLATQCQWPWKTNDNGLGNPVPVDLAIQSQCIYQLSNSRLGNSVPVDLAVVSVSNFGKVHPLHCESLIMALSLQMPVFHRLMCASMMGMTDAGRIPTFTWENSAGERLSLTTQSCRPNAFGITIEERPNQIQMQRLFINEAPVYQPGPRHSQITPADNRFHQSVPGCE